MKLPAINSCFTDLLASGARSGNAPHHQPRQYVNTISECEVVVEALKKQCFHSSSTVPS